MSASTRPRSRYRVAVPRSRRSSARRMASPRCCRAAGHRAEARRRAQLRAAPTGCEGVGGAARGSRPPERPRSPRSQLGRPRSRRRIVCPGDPTIGFLRPVPVAPRRFWTSPPGLAGPEGLGRVRDAHGPRARVMVIVVRPVPRSPGGGGVFPSGGSSSRTAAARPTACTTRTARSRSASRSPLVLRAGGGAEAAPLVRRHDPPRRGARRSRVHDGLVRALWDRVPPLARGSGSSP